MFSRNTIRRIALGRSPLARLIRIKKVGRLGICIWPRWRPVTLAAIKRYPEFLRNEEVAELQLLAGQPSAKISDIRSHVYTYVKDGLYERGDAGAFRATAKAAQAMGIPLGSSNDDGRTGSSQGEPGSGQPRLGLNDLESVEAVDAARKAGGT